MSGNTKELFIPGGSDLPGNDPLCLRLSSLDAATLKSRWDSATGKAIFDGWAKSGYDRQALDGHVGKYSGQTDLRGVPLKNLKLESKNFSAIDFFAADFSGSRFDKCDLSDSWLSHVDLRGTSLQHCNLSKVLVDGVKFDNTTAFTGVNLNEINFTLAARLQDAALRQAWIADLESNAPKTAFLLRITSDYGRSFSRFSIWAFIVVMGFAIFYWQVPNAIDKQGFLNSLYFSIVTFTTLGYGDIHPVSAYGILAVIAEVILGYLMLGLLVAIISKKVLGS